MFRGEAGRRIFARVQESGYLFDLEVLVLAHRAGLRVAEVPIRWTEVPGGHFSPARELPRVLIGLWKLRRRLKER
jgi:dolichyl-phosphate beta-glucosyltransferase